MRTLLVKLDSDRRNGTDFFTHKFMGKVEEIFSGLPKPKDMRSFEGNDLPLLFTNDTCKRAGQISGAFEKSRRRDFVPFNHHQECQSLPDAEADQLLDWCEEE